MLCRSDYNSDEQYFLAVVDYVYGNNTVHVQQQFSGEQRRTVKQLRDYGREVQPIDVYRDILCPPIGDDKRRSVPNISWDLKRVYGTYRQRIIDKLQNVIPNAQPRANDITSTLEKKTITNKYRLQTDPRVKAAMQENPYMNANVPQGLETPDDVDVFEASGGPSLPIEAEMKDKIDSIAANPSNSPIFKSVIEDFIDLNKAAVHIVKSPTGQYELRYIDFANVIMPFSSHEMADDVEYIGYTEYWNKAQLISAGLPNDLVKTIMASRGSTQAVNVDNSGTRESYVSTNSSRAANTSRINVLTLYFIVNEQERYVEGRHKTGNRTFDAVGEDSKLKTKDELAGKKIVEVFVHRLMRVSWVIGTKHIFNYGYAEDVVYQGPNGKKRPCFPIIVFNSSALSTTEKCISPIDEINIATYKLRQVIAKLPPGPRMVIDQSKLEASVKIANVNYTILDMLSVYSSEGIFVINSTDPGGYAEDTDRSRSQPISFIQSGVQEDMNIFAQIIMNEKDAIRDVTGLNQIADGTNTSPDLLKGVVESMNQAANSAVMPLVRDYFSFFRRICEYAAGLWVLRDMAGEGVASNTLKGDIRRLSSATYDIAIQLVSPESKRMMMQLLASKQMQIPASAYLSILRCIEDDDLAKANILLIKAESDAIKQAQQNQENAIRVQSEEQAKAQMAVERQKAEMEASRVKMEMEMEAYKAKLEETAAIEKHKRDKEILYLSHELDTKGGIRVADANKTHS